VLKKIGKPRRRQKGEGVRCVTSVQLREESEEGAGCRSKETLSGNDEESAR
jgi:hypothetical protein